MRGDQIAEVVGKLRDGEVVNLMVKVVADSANRSGIGFDGLGLQTFEFEVL